MRIRTGLSLIVFITVITVLVSGCTDELGLVDFSGELSLETTNDSWPYRIIQETSYNNFWVSPGSRLAEERSKLGLNQTLTIGKTEYLVAVSFVGGYSPFGDYEVDDYIGFHVNVYNFTTHKRVKTFVISQSDSGDSWNCTLDYDDDYANHYLGREGECLLTFFDPDTGADYFVKSVYSVNSVAERKTNKKGLFILDGDGDYKYERLFVKADAKVSIGTRQCLSGYKVIAGKKIGFYVLDWNLDGRFTEEDTVYCDYRNTFYDFGKSIRLTNSTKESEDNKYILNLIQPEKDGDDYRLQLQLFEKGIREEK